MKKTNTASAVFVFFVKKGIAILKKLCYNNTEKMKDRGTHQMTAKADGACGGV